MILRKIIDSPAGSLIVAADELAVREIRFAGTVRELPPPDERLETGAAETLLDRAERELSEYFAGSRRDFTFPIAPAGTPFQQEVWSALRTIPYGETRTYGQIAASVGRPRACRAVGMANNRNPIAIVVPCHRVVGSSGALTGYAGGLDAKALLLRIECR